MLSLYPFDSTICQSLKLKLELELLWEVRVLAPLERLPPPAVNVPLSHQQAIAHSSQFLRRVLALMTPPVQLDPIHRSSLGYTTEEPLLSSPESTTQAPTDSEPTPTFTVTSPLIYSFTPHAPMNQYHLQSTVLTIPRRGTAEALDLSLERSIRIGGAERFYSP
ncbi:hypothetical protein PC9H_002714 [Pleurotus ostreatus]|uniref:Uncharacterized protein n=1 Tax=Pleurotus ostreatus TaxID=5322 RepID=A0A8H6ZL82_PLEOS|nr:uncharacterized protein PC9H_002714 [Pleurotus ostreatus]KAF7416448.1 hypothetical protein PC9H_002714 [Pleurotus ostreatus]